METWKMRKNAYFITLEIWGDKNRRMLQKKTPLNSGLDHLETKSSHSWFWMKENAKQTQHWQEMSKVAKYFIQEVIWMLVVGQKEPH